MDRYRVLKRQKHVNQGDLTASEITMSEEERIRLLLQVKEKRITMQDALQRVKTYEDERRPSLPENLNTDVAKLRDSLPAKSSSSSSLFAKLASSYKRKSKSEESRSSSSECSPRHQLFVTGDINISDPKGLQTSADYAELEDVAIAAAKIQGLDTRVRHQSQSCSNSPKRTRKFFKTSKSSDEPLSHLAQSSGGSDDRKSFLFSLRKKLSIDISQSADQGSSELDSGKDSEKETKDKAKERGKAKKEKSKSTKEKTKETKASEKAAKEKSKSVKDKAKNKTKEKLKEKSGTFPKDRKSGLSQYKESIAVTGQQQTKSKYSKDKATEGAKQHSTLEKKEKRQSSGSRIPGPSGRRTNGESDSQSETERYSRVPKPLNTQDSRSIVRKSRYATKLEGPSDAKDSKNKQLKQSRSLSREGNKSSGDESSRSSTGSRLPVKAGSDTPPRSPTYRILPKIRTERADSSGSVSSLNSQSSATSLNRNLLRSSSRSPGPLGSHSRSPSRSPSRSSNTSISATPKRHSSPLLQANKKLYREPSPHYADNRASPRPDDSVEKDNDLMPNKSFLFGSGGTSPILRPHAQTAQRSPKAYSSVEGFSRKKGQMFVGECDVVTPNSRHSLSDRFKNMKDKVKTRLRRNKTASSVDILDGCDEDEDENCLAEKDVGFQPASTSSSPSSMSVEEEDQIHKGPFVGRARVIRSYMPSPYDREALTLREGDIVNITSKHESGIWRGVTNNKEGTFKFINVEVLPEEKPQPQRKTRLISRHSSRQSRRRPKPRTVGELMERLGLEDLTGIFLLNGFESLEHFSELEEVDLDELCINKPEQRAKILTAAQMIRDYEGDAESDVSMSPSLVRSQRGQENTVTNINIIQNANSLVHSIVRDSGCYPSMDGLHQGEWNHETMMLTRGPEITCKANTQSSTQTVAQPEGSPKSILKHRDSGSPIPKVIEISQITSGGSQSLPGSPSRGRPQGPRVAQITGSYVANRSLSQPPKKVTSMSANASPNRTPSPISKVHHSSTSSLTIECRRAPWQPPPPSGSPKPNIPERSSSLANKSPNDSGKTNQVTNQMTNQVTVEIPWPLQKDYAANLNSRTMSTPNISAKNTPPGSPAHRAMNSQSKQNLECMREVSASLEMLISKKLQSEDIDLTTLPYTDKCGFCGIPAALVQRYAEELRRGIHEVAEGLDECRMNLLKNEKKLAVPNYCLGDTATRSLQDTVSTSSLQDFLLSIGLPMYIDSLYSQNIRSLEAMLTMSDLDLLNCGVMDSRHRENLLRARDLLRIKMPSLARPTVTRKLSDVRDKV